VRKIREKLCKTMV